MESTWKPKLHPQNKTNDQPAFNLTQRQGEVHLSQEIYKPTI
jgi:hypothetical protein